MKKFFAVLFALALLPLVGCAGAPSADTPEDTTPLIPKKVDNYNYPAIQDKLTWEKINALPMKSEDMTVQEMRETGDRDHLGSLPEDPGGRGGAGHRAGSARGRIRED